VLTCNNLKTDYDAGYPFKLYTSRDSKSCAEYPRGGVGQACKDACLAQYNSCSDTYGGSCRLGRGADSYDGALRKCKAQYSDCIDNNVGTNGKGRCGTWNAGWY
jgi:hypothetical protein